MNDNPTNADEQYELGRKYWKGDGVPQDIEKAAYWFIKAAEQGNAEAQFRLGTIDFPKDGVPFAVFLEDLEKAIYWLTKAAEQGNGYAQMHLGDNYANGIGVKQDLEKANYWTAKAAEQGMELMAQEEIDLLLMSISAGDSVILSAAEQGSKTAQVMLGVKYDESVPKDCEKAAYWFTKAAEQGDGYAQMRLGYSYANGEGVPKDFEKANYWFTKAVEQGNKSTANYWFTKDAEQGNEIAQLHLGYIYANGNGVSRDKGKARYWLSKAAEQNGEAAENAKKILATMDYLP